jgi:methionyl-tRNA formyltransferase
MKTVIVATPHKRNDHLVKQIAERLPNHRIVRIAARKELNLEYIQSLAPDWIFFPHWSWLIPDEIHSRYECVIFHMTDLPYGRGGSPLQNLIVRGHKETKLTALKCASGLDRGPIYKKVPLLLDGTAEAILGRAADLMEDLIVDIVERQPTPVQQAGDVVEFKRRRPEDGDLNKVETLDQVYDYIRMLDGEGYPAAFLETANFRFEFSQVRREDGWLEAKVRIGSRTHG